MPRKKKLSRNDYAILEILSNGWCSFSTIKEGIWSRGLKICCVESIVEGLVRAGYVAQNVKEDGLFLYSSKNKANPFLKCLGCGQLFESAGTHNRQCPNCREKARRDTNCMMNEGR